MTTITKRLAAEAKQRQRQHQTVGPVHPYAGRDIPFTIVGKSEAPLDVGEIRLETAP